MCPVSKEYTITRHRETAWEISNFARHVDSHLGTSSREQRTKRIAHISSSPCVVKQKRSRTVMVMTDREMHVDPVSSVTINVEGSPQPTRYSAEFLDNVDQDMPGPATGINDDTVQISTMNCESPNQEQSDLSLSESDISIIDEVTTQQEDENNHCYDEDGLFKDQCEPRPSFDESRYMTENLEKTIDLEETDATTSCRTLTVEVDNRLQMIPDDPQADINNNNNIDEGEEVFGE